MQGAGGSGGAQGAQGHQGHQGVQGSTGGGGGPGAQGHQGRQGAAGSNGSDAAFPSGVITLWSGSSGSIPSGWVLCNGSNSTPDLRDRFVIGAGNNYSVGAQGGSKDAVVVSHTHNLNHNHTYSSSTNSTGSHSHSGSTNSTGAHTHGILYADDDQQNTPSTNLRVWNQVNNPSTYHTTSAGNHSHTISTNSTGSHAHSFSGTTAAFNGASQGASGGVSGTDKNLPPYYALCYIMKT